MWAALACSALLLTTGASRVRADAVEMQNGDRYMGKVLSLNATTLVLQNDVLGTVHLPRARVVQITLGSTPATRPAKTSAPAGGPGVPEVSGTNVTADLSLALRQLGANTNLIRQVQEQFLSAAGPEANTRFNELVGGLANGTVSINDLRGQAKSAADQLRALKSNLGEDTGWALDGYLAILDNFLNETAPGGGSVTNTPKPAAGPGLARRPQD